MLMIGVIPLPALMNSSFSGSGVGQHEVALDAAEADDRPGLRLPDEVGRDLALVDQLRRDADAAVGRPGSEVSEYARQWKMPSTTTPTRRYCPGSWPSHSCPGRMKIVTASPVSRLDPLDPAAQLARRPQRVDQLQIVVGEQRREEGAHGRQAPGDGSVRSAERRPSRPRYGRYGPAARKAPSPHPSQEGTTVFRNAFLPGRADNGSMWSYDLWRSTSTSSLAHVRPPRQRLRAAQHAAGAERGLDRVDRQVHVAAVRRAHVEDLLRGILDAAGDRLAVEAEADRVVPDRAVDALDPENMRAARATVPSSPSTHGRGSPLPARWPMCMRTSRRLRRGVVVECVAVAAGVGGRGRWPQVGGQERPARQHRGGVRQQARGRRPTMLNTPADHGSPRPVEIEEGRLGLEVGELLLSVGSA